jgi:hypothetical protein
VFHLVHGLDKCLVIQHVEQPVNGLVAVAGARSDVLRKDPLSPLDGVCDMCFGTHYSTPERNIYADKTAKSGVSSRF